MAYSTFEDLELYKKARLFRNSIYSLIKKLPDEERYNLGSQMRRAATSLTNNIAEGHGRYHFQESIQFCRTARGSLAELIDDLNIIVDQSYAPAELVDNLKTLANEVNKLLNGYIAFLKKRKESDG